QVTVDAGVQESNVAGTSGKDKELLQEYILLPIHPHRTKIQIEAVAQDAQEKSSKNASKDKDVQDSEDDAEQMLQDELKKMITQEMVAQAVNDAARQEFEEDKRNNASSNEVVQAIGTNTLSTDRQNVSTTNIDSNANADSDDFSNKGIFSGAYNDNDVGAEDDVNNMDNTIV
ncbi:hypothetical protein Tco_0358591, partial [Tanacetum coccineum]